MKNHVVPNNLFHIFQFNLKVNLYKFNAHLDFFYIILITSLDVYMDH